MNPATHMHAWQSQLESPLPFLGEWQAREPFDVLDIFKKTFGNTTAIFLESSDTSIPDESHRWLIWAGIPAYEFFGSRSQPQLKTPSFEGPAPFSLLELFDLIGKASVVPPDDSFSFFSQAWFGVVSYEWGHNLHLPNFKVSHPQIPDFYFFKPSQVFVWDRFEKKGLAWGGFPHLDSTTHALASDFSVNHFSRSMHIDHYLDAIHQAKKFITEGDLYQINFAHRFQAQWTGPPLELYRRLHTLNPGPFMAFFQTPQFVIVSSSPERLISGHGESLETRPIAGTRRRSKSPEEDERLKHELQTDPKEQAEHIMLVDLARNDLGRIAQWGSVQVHTLAAIETYAHVHHLVSKIQAQRHPTSSLSEIFKSLFPGGTITGCPKIHCMEIIHQLEPVPRGFYTGSLGYLAPGPCFDFNILIRTFCLFSDSHLEFHAGSGIVADSNPQREYEETLHKVETLAHSLGFSLL